MLQTKTIEAIQAIVSNYFKSSRGNPYQMTVGQCEIFHAVTSQDYDWVWASAPTRYGKTETVAMAILFLAAFHNLKIPIVAGSEDKAKKIMEYIVMHIADHEALYEGLIIDDLADVEKLKVQMSKNALRWSTGGWIFVTSVDSRSLKREGEGVVGEGGDVVILEEAGLIKHKEQFSKIVRMPEKDNEWGKLVMIGNCVEGSVFEEAFNNPLYHKVRISLEQSIAEGRYTDQQLAEKKSQTTSKDWLRYYEVKFPAINQFTYFKPSKYDYLPQSKDLKYYGAVDLALGESLKGSLVGIVVIGVDEKKQMYEAYSLGQIMKPDEIIRTIFSLPYKFHYFKIETVQFQKYFFNQIDQMSKDKQKFIPFQPMLQKRKKEERIESLEPHINSKHILFKGDNELWDEMQSYPQSEHFDVLDALEMCIRDLVKAEFDFAFG